MPQIGGTPPTVRFLVLAVIARNLMVNSLVVIQSCNSCSTNITIVIFATVGLMAAVILEMFLLCAHVYYKSCSKKEEVTVPYERLAN